MKTTNLNSRMDKDVKESADKLFNELGLSMSGAINLFLRTSIREQGIPFQVTLNPNQETISAVEEGRRITGNDNIVGYRFIDELKDVLDV